MSTTHVPIPPPHHPLYDIQKVVRDALLEDAGNRGDITTLATVPEGTQAAATFLAKADGVLAGLGVADIVFEIVDPSLQVTWTAADGQAVRAGQQFGTVRGSTRSILVAERIALNFMQRMSGIASATALMVVALDGLPTRILETRKTAPGLRLLDKWAVLIGGGTNHRMGLFDMMMIKDNHVTAAGGLGAAVARAERYIQEQGLDDVCIEVETRTLAEVDEILAVISAARAAESSGSGTRCHVTRVMLDNMTKPLPDGSGVDVSMLRAAVERIAGAVDTEASGNVSLANCRAMASTGVNYLSCGSLTHSVAALDISLKIHTMQ